MNRIYWKGICHDERIRAISEISDIVNRYGIIVNFQKFSDVILGMVVEIESDQVDALYNSLSRILTLEGHDSANIAAKGEIILMLNVTFAKSTGDLKIEVPSMPE
jgi:hypothetical protein